MTSDPGADVVIVGGGIAGLAAAWRLRERRLILLEAGDRAGGRIRSEPRGEYWLNLGAHLFPPPGSVLRGLMAEVGLEAAPVTAGLTALSAYGKLLAQGRVEMYPFLLPLPLGARAALVRTGLRIHAGVREYRALSRTSAEEDPKAAGARLLAFRADQTFADYIGPVPNEVAAILRPAVNRISAEPEEVSAGAGIALFQFAGIFSRDRQGSQHANLAGGSGRLPDALAGQLGDRVVLGAEATRVRQTADGVHVDFELQGRHESLQARCAVVATPAPVTGRIVSGLPAAMRAALEGITYGPYVVGAILTRETGPMPWDRFYALLAVGRSFNFLFNTVSVLRSEGKRKPGGALMVYGAAGLGRALLEQDDREVRDRFLRDLEDIFPGTGKIVEEVVIRRWALGIPYAGPGRHLLQPALEQPLGRIVLAGDYLSGFAEMETAAQSGVEAAAQVESILSAPLPGHPPTRLSSVSRSTS